MYTASQRLQARSQKVTLAIGFHTEYFVGGSFFLESKIDIKHTLLRGSGGMPPRKCLTNHCPEIACLAAS